MAAVQIQAADETGGCDSGAVASGNASCAYAFRIGTLHQVRPVGTYINGNVVKGVSFVVVADVIPIAGNFQYGTLASFCLRVVKRAARTSYPRGWLITGFDTLQTAVSGTPPHGCKTTPNALRASGAPG